MGAAAGAVCAACDPPPLPPRAQVPTHGSPFKLLKRFVAGWGLAELYRNPGPIQFEGPGANDVALSLAADTHDYVSRIDSLRAALEAIRSVCRPGVSDGILDAALTGATSLAHILSVMKERE